MASLLRLSICLSVCLSLTALAYAQYAPDAEVVKSDIPLIKCAVCERMVDELLDQTEREKEKAEPKKVGENVLRSYHPLICHHLVFGAWCDMCSTKPFQSAANEFDSRVFAVSASPR